MTVFAIPQQIAIWVTSTEQLASVYALLGGAAPVAQAQPSPTPSPTASKAAEKVGQQASDTVDAEALIADAKKAAAIYQQDNQREGLIALLEKFGAKQISSIDPSKLADFIAEADPEGKRNA